MVGTGCLAIDEAVRDAVSACPFKTARAPRECERIGELEAQPPTSWNAIGLADLHAALGNKDEAFRWLAYDPPHGWLPWSRVNPALEPLRDDPRFGELLRRLNLPAVERLASH